MSSSPERSPGSTSASAVHRPEGDMRPRPFSIVRISASLSAVAFAIIVVAFIARTMFHRTTGVTQQNWHTLFWYFDVGREYNVATWYASGLWLLLGAAAAIIAVTRPRHRFSWWLLAVVALFASVDEYLEIHERFDGLGNRIAAYLPFDIGFTWVLVGAPLALLVVLLLLRMWISLPRRAQLAIALGGILFLAGAIGVETINGRIIQANAWEVNDAFVHGTMLEELLEMAGVATALAGVVSLFVRDARHGGVHRDPALDRRADRDGGQPDRDEGDLRAG